MVSDRCHLAVALTNVELGQSSSIPKSVDRFGYQPRPVTVLDYRCVWDDSLVIDEENKGSCILSLECHGAHKEVDKCANIFLGKSAFEPVLDCVTPYIALRPTRVVWLRVA